MFVSYPAIGTFEIFDFPLFFFCYTPIYFLLRPCPYVTCDIHDAPASYFVSPMPHIRFVLVHVKRRYVSGGTRAAVIMISVPRLSPSLPALRSPFRDLEIGTKLQNVALQASDLLRLRCDLNTCLSLWDFISIYIWIDMYLCSNYIIGTVDLYIYLCRSHTVVRLQPRRRTAFEECALRRKHLRRLLSSRKLPSHRGDLCLVG